MRINKMIPSENSLIFYQILSAHSLRKCIEISLENLYVYILGLKGLKELLRTYKLSLLLNEYGEFYFKIQVHKILTAVSVSEE